LPRRPVATKTDYIRIRLSPKLKMALERKALAEGKSMSEYLRYIIEEKLKET